MTSFKRIEANRRNARKSAGPVTQEGKQLRWRTPNITKRSKQ
jgi:hypothetical protein